MITSRSSPCTFSRFFINRELSSPTIILITDRTDLDDQLLEMFAKAMSNFKIACAKNAVLMMT
ncbi:MAG: hypothetical protein AB8B79_20030 [Granulosicoccus sp.]